MPEPATFRPHWPLPERRDRDEAVVDGKPVGDRLAIAAQAIPGGTQQRSQLSLNE